MSPAIYRARELTVSYKPFRLTLPGLVPGRLSTARDLARVACGLLANASVEKCLALHVNAQHGLIGVHVLSVGVLDASLVHPREVFKAACLSNAAAVLFVHNHPSGDVTPSPEDRQVVGRLRRAGELLGIEVLDALIVADPIEGFRYFSFREAGVLP